MPYKLSASLALHSSDVRALASPTDDLILSASRDATAILWQKPDPSARFQQERTFKPGSGYVNAVTIIPPTPDAPKGYAVTAGQDMVINVYRLDSSQEEPVYTLIGHENNVCALHTASDGTIISGSWDSTAKAWKDFKLTYDLKGHAQSVLTVLAIDGEEFVTGSADKRIKLWKRDKVVRTFDGHTDAVRGLALVTDIGFASCSNDSEIRVWALEGDLIYSLSGHTSFIYGLSILPNGDVVSCGEDRSVRVWRDGECIQTIIHPAISVWTVSSLPNGDIVSGCSDHVVRVFSVAEERWLPEADLKVYDEQVANQALPSQQIGDVKMSDLPGLEALNVPGKKPGETKMIKNEGAVEAHQWDAASNQWTKIGTVVDAVGSGRKQLYKGKEWDYVFDVDVQEGAPPLKLPYNAAENPWHAAQRFLQDHELPMSYLDEVVRFIEKNTAGVSLGGGGSQYSDPFTGASRYQPSSGSVPASNTGVDPFTGASRYQPATNTSIPSGTGGVDPFTGASRYQPASNPSPRAQSGHSDPFTGANRYQPTPSPGRTPGPSSPTPPTQSSGNIIPHRTPINFRQCNIPAMRAKLTELNNEVRKEISTATLALHPEEVVLFTQMFDYLAVVSGGRNSWRAVPGEQHIEALIQVLDRWPAIHRYPVIDLARLIVAFAPQPLHADSGLGDRFMDALLRASDWDEHWTPPMTKPKERNILLLLRTIANAFQENTKFENINWALKIFSLAEPLPNELFTAPQRIVGSTLLLNFSCLALNTSPEPSLRPLVLDLMLKIINYQPNDAEAVYRALVALGNILYAAKKFNDPLSAEEAARVGPAIESVEKLTFASKSGHAAVDLAAEKRRIGNVAKEILTTM